MPEEKKPFGALLGALSLVVSALFVAGFSYRWSYYYNFGLNHLLFGFSLQSVLISAMELLRTPANAALTAAFFAFALLVLQCAVWSFRKLLSFVGNPKWTKQLSTEPGLGMRFALDATRALVLIYAGFLAGNVVGWRTFQEHRIDGSNNPLPNVTLVFGEVENTPPEALLCNRSVVKDRLFLGSAITLKQLDEELGGCSGRARSWRLLYQDNDYVYVFAAVPADRNVAAGRPITLAIPRREDMVMVLD